ncbi:DUF4179 domain-containing protein [Paenibacillus sp. FA6]|uniref:DUF4179 domain-containing protein n=1 Tax=Paenibacillus sp. FA6 TaxID=3413029 RepID=UPI003F655CFE
MNSHTDLEDNEILKLKRLILETPVEVDLTDRIMERYENNNMKTITVTHQQKGWRRAMIFAATAIIIFTVVTATGFISPTMAASIKRIPGMDSIFQLAGDLGLKAADEKGLFTVPNASDTHDGLTVQATAVSFDGTRVSIGIERKVSDNHLFEETLIESINGVNLSIKGESSKSYSTTGGGNRTGVVMHPSPDANSLILEFSDLRNQGGEALPQKFEISLDLKVSGIRGPFKLNIPVEMNTKNNVVLTPSINRNVEDINLKLEKIELTPITTNITTRIELPENMKISSLELIGYDLFNEKGEQAQETGGQGSSATNGNVLIMDTRFEPFESIPKSITLKPFHYVYKDYPANEFEIGEDGHVKVEYIPELEMTLPVTSK